MLHSPPPDPERVELLVAFADLSGYARLSQSWDCVENFVFIREFCGRVAGLTGDAGGTVIKFIGDAALLTWPAERTDAGVRALFALKDDVDGWLNDAGYSSRLVIKAHVGEVARGPIGLGDQARPDVLGATVNIAALIPSQGLAVTPQVFRRLEPATRQLLKKHTPPVTYIPVEARHRDR